MSKNRFIRNTDPRHRVIGQIPNAQGNSQVTDPTRMIIKNILEKQRTNRATLSLELQLIDAAENGDIDDIKRLAAEGKVNINAQDERGITPLMAAVKFYNKSFPFGFYILEFLVNHGAEVKEDELRSIISPEDIKKLVDIKNTYSLEREKEARNLFNTIVVFGNGRASNDEFLLPPHEMIEKIADHVTPGGEITPIENKEIRDKSWNFVEALDEQRKGNNKKIEEILEQASKSESRSIIKEILHDRVGPQVSGSNGQRIGL